MSDPRSPRPHVVGELGLDVARDGAHVVGRAEVFAELCVPGTDALRTSVLATWVDVVTGYVSFDALAPRIPLTLDLEVEVARPARLGEHVVLEASTVRAGRTVAVTEATLRLDDDGLDCGDGLDGEVLAVAFASFVPAGDPAQAFPEGMPIPHASARLAVPLAERLGRVVEAPGVVTVPRLPDALNTVGAMQGGVVAFTVEEAAAAAWTQPAPLLALHLRYLRPVMVGPARAVATVVGDGVSVVRLTDAGTGKLAATATVRRAPGAGPG